MYNSFFGFNEEPFGVTPDPKFLYKSKNHEEAIAHINYGISQNKGFVMLTGEIGSGKTTIIRYFLNSFETNRLHSSLILNPKVDSLELLRLINHDFGIKAEVSTYKELLNSLNAFLIECFEKDEPAALIIDEAQEMSIECLEFVRLLSNIETDTKKLIQVILVGQPELKETIKSKRLRQLDQRIAVRYHLEPLDFEDTGKYIRHRLKVAGSGMITFPEKGLKDIYRFSCGIPRLINLFCDRTLMAAYARGEIKISASLIKGVLAELDKTEYAKTEQDKRSLLLKPAFAGVVLFVIILFFIYSGALKDDSYFEHKKPKADIFMKGGIYMASNAALSEKAGILNLLSIYGEEKVNASAPEDEVKKRGYSVYRFKDMDRVMQFKIPVMLKLKEANSMKYVTLRWVVGEDTLILDPIEGERIVPLKPLKDLTVDIQLIYKNKYNSSDKYKKLEEALKESGLINYEPKGDFGPKAKKALSEFQGMNGLKKTGSLDEETAILLSRDSRVPSIIP